MKNQEQIRNSFWESYPQFKAEKRSKKRQNDYKTDIRISFCDHVENLRNNGQITEKLAKKATL